MASNSTYRWYHDDNLAHTWEALVVEEGSTDTQDATRSAVEKAFAITSRGDEMLIC